MACTSPATDSFMANATARRRPRTHRPRAQPIDVPWWESMVSAESMTRRASPSARPAGARRRAERGGRQGALARTELLRARRRSGKHSGQRRCGVSSQRPSQASGGRHRKAQRLASSSWPVWLGTSAARRLRDPVRRQRRSANCGRTRGDRRSAQQLVDFGRGRARSSPRVGQRTEQTGRAGREESAMGSEAVAGAQAGLCRGRAAAQAREAISARARVDRRTPSAAPRLVRGGRDGVGRARRRTVRARARERLDEMGRARAGGGVSAAAAVVDSRDRERDGRQHVRLRRLALTPARRARTAFRVTSDPVPGRGQACRVAAVPQRCASPINSR